jgi:hypothetical protein
MAWEIEGTDQFAEWYRSLHDAEQAALDYSIGVLEQEGPALGRPHVDHVDRSRHANMKELRTQVRGRPIRTFFAFDPHRTAILLIGGDKTGNPDFYNEMIPVADALYDEHLATLAREAHERNQR